MIVQVTCVRLHSGLLLSSSEDHTVRVWYLATMTCTLVLEGHRDQVRSADMHSRHGGSRLNGLTRQADACCFVFGNCGVLLGRLNAPRERRSAALSCRMAPSLVGAWTTPSRFGISRQASARTRSLATQAVCDQKRHK
jgi:hypothetical protein